MDLIQDTATPRPYLRRHGIFGGRMLSLWQSRADMSFPPTRWFLCQIRYQSSFRAWPIAPLNSREQPTSSVATTTGVLEVAMGQVLEACDVTGPGVCDAREGGETVQVPRLHLWLNGANAAAHE